MLQIGSSWGRGAARLPAPTAGSSGKMGERATHRAFGVSRACGPPPAHTPDATSGQAAAPEAAGARSGAKQGVGRRSAINDKTRRTGGSSALERGKQHVKRRPGRAPTAVRAARRTGMDMGQRPCRAPIAKGRRPAGLLRRKRHLRKPGGARGRGYRARGRRFPGARLRLQGVKSWGLLEGGPQMRGKKPDGFGNQDAGPSSQRVTMWEFQGVCTKGQGVAELLEVGSTVGGG
jgi:hypothetical protein